MPEQRPQPPGKLGRRWKRTAATALLLLAGGAVVNVAVAWGCAIRLVPNPAKPAQWTAHPQWRGYLTLDEETWILNGYRRTGCAYIIALKRGPRTSPPGTEVVEIESLPRWSLYHASSTSSPYRMRHEFAFGLPLHCMTSHRDFNPVNGGEQTTGMLAAPEIARKFGPGRDVPTRVIVPGFISNTVFYALLLWLLVATPLAARTMLRRRRGLCAKCAYPIGLSPVCTECGAAVLRERG